MKKPVEISSKSNKVVGKERKRVDSLSKVEGRAQFTDDLDFPNMLYGVIKRSPHCHGLIKSIDIEEALKLPGTRAVITGKDLPQKFGILPVTQDETAMAIDKVRYMGEPVAALCADTLEEAYQAAELIHIEYELLPSIVSIEDALRKDARVHDSPKFEGNAHRKISLQFGDVDQGFQDSDHVFEDLYFYSGNTHLPAEPHSAISHFQDGFLTIYASHQAPYYLNLILPKVLQIQPHQLRIVVPYVGGGFGGKLDPFPEIICSAKLAMITGRPVKITLTREEVFYNHRGRHPAYMAIRTGIKDKRIESLEIRSYLDGGAYGSFGVACSYYFGALETTTYVIPRYRAKTVRFYTNKPPCGPKRGHGTPQPRFALETHIDKIAEKLGMDPVEFRLENLAPPHCQTVNYLRVTSSALRECIEKVAQESRFSQKWKKLPYGEGIGFAVGCYLSGAALPIYWNDLPHSEVLIKADRFGTVSLYSGHTEIGQGSDTVLAFIGAEVLGLRPSEIHLILRDSAVVPPDMGSYSSRVTMMMGNAAKNAALKLKEAILQAVSEEWGLAPSQIVLEDGKVKSRIHDQEMTFGEACYLTEAKRGGPLVFTGSYQPKVPVGPYKGSGVGPSPAYSFSACALQVQINLQTGEIHPKEIWMAHDIGKCINPSAVEGQIEGSIHMALGEALWEESAYHPTLGLQKGINLLEYKMPTLSQMPKMNIFIIESPEEEGPFGAKEVGQGPLLPVIPALANAIYDAIGVRFDEIPITPPKVFRALERKLARVGPKKEPEFDFPTPIIVEGGGYEPLSIL